MGGEPYNPPKESFVSLSAIGIIRISRNHTHFSRIAPFLHFHSSNIFFLSQIRPFHKHPFLKPLSIVSSPQIRLPFPLLLPAHIFNPIPPLHLPSITTDRFPRYTPIHHKKNTLSIGVSLFVVSVVQRKKHSSSCRLLNIPPVSTVQILFVISTMR